MAHSLSAQKRIRQNEKRRARNRARKDAVRTETKAFAKAVIAGDATTAEQAFNSASSKLDRVAMKGTLHVNTARRRRSQLAKRLNALKAQGGTAA